MDETVKDIKQSKKALFIQRFVAFIIDMILVTYAAAIISTPFINGEKIIKLSEEAQEVMNNYFDGKSTPEVYIEQYSSIYYKTSKYNGLTTLITILLSVVYFIVFQLYNKGQTLGKKLMKIRVVSDTGEFNMNQMIFREFISKFILVNMINFILMLITKNDIYLYSSVLISFIQYIIIIISMIMIKTKEDGCAIHDRIAHTKVIREN